MPNPIHIIFDKLPGPDAPRFIEVEDGNGNSISVGEWREREDGTAELVIPVAQEREAVGVAVRPLEWTDRIEGGAFSGKAGIGPDYVFFRASNGEFICPTVALPIDPPLLTKEAAKAAAEADWQQRIRSALVSPPIGAATHRHKKRGDEYMLIGVGRMQAKNWRSIYWTGKKDALGFPEGDLHVVDMSEVAIYRSVDDGTWWVRPREEFEDGRFEKIVSPSAAPSDPSDTFAAWVNQGPALAKAAGLYVGIKIYPSEQAARDAGDIS